MQLNNRNNNTRDAVNVNTRGIQFMNSESKFFPSTLQFGFWNEMISLRINPALDKSEQTDNKKFNYEETVNTAIILEKAVVLIKKIKEDILPKYGKEETFRGVSIGGNSLVGVGLKNVDDKVVSFLAIHKGLDENTRKPQESIYYEFKTSYTVNDYDEKTGEFTVEQDIPSELLLFVKALEASVTALTNANAHATRTVDRWFREKTTRQIDEIGAKLGVAPQSRGGGNFSNFRSKDVFGSGGGNTSPASNNTVDLGADASTETVTNFDSMSDFLDLPAS